MLTNLSKVNDGVLKRTQANALSVSDAIQSVICRTLQICSEINTKRKRIKNYKKEYKKTKIKK